MRRKQSDKAQAPMQTYVSRPVVSWRDGLARLLILLTGGFLGALLISIFFPLTRNHLFAFADACIMTLALFTARSNVVLAIRLYRRYAPSHVRLRCAMTPTCSEYALLAISRHGLLRGVWMTMQRLRHRCNGTPVTDFP